MATRSCAEKSETMGNEIALASSKICLNRLIGFLFVRSIGSLSQARDDYGHVVGLLWRAGPFFCGVHQGLGDDLRGRTLHLYRGFLHASDAEFLTVSIFCLDQAIALAHE